MRQKPLAKWTPVEVEWEDIKVDSASCDSADFLKSYKPCRRRTLGYVIDQSDKYLVVAETDDRNAESGDGDCERVNTILYANILTVTQLSRPTPKARGKKS